MVVSALTTVSPESSQHDPQHAVRAGVLRPHVDGHRLGAQFGVDISFWLSVSALRSQFWVRRQRPPANSREPSSNRSLHQRADRVNHRAMHFLDAGGGFVRHVECESRRPADRSAVASGQRHGRQPARLRRLQSRQHVRRLAARRNAERDVPGRPSASICRANTRSNV